jgi:DNA-binding transcriptional ArsR family regulator
VISNDTLTDNERAKVHAMSLLGDETRFRLFKLLLQKDGSCVGDLAKQLNITPSAVSQHFKNFELLGLITKVRVGQKICYSIKEDSKLANSLISFTNI